MLRSLMRTTFGSSERTEVTASLAFTHLCPPGRMTVANLPQNDVDKPSAWNGYFFVILSVSCALEILNICAQKCWKSTYFCKNDPLCIHFTFLYDPAWNNFAWNPLSASYDPHHGPWARMPCWVGFWYCALNSETRPKDGRIWSCSAVEPYVVWC